MQGQYPVDNNTYNLMQMTVSKLESIEAYQKYLKDADDQTRGIIEELLQQDRQAVNRLMEALKRSFK
jgi:hypothetical protein